MQMKNLILGVAGLMTVASAAQAVVLVDFQPISDVTSTLSFQGPVETRTLSANPNAVLQFRSFIPVNDPDGIQFPGGTQFNNVQLVLTSGSGAVIGIPVKKDAVDTGTSLVVQALVAGHFKFIDRTDSNVLLEGDLLTSTTSGRRTIDANVLNGVFDSPTGAIQFAAVSYTGGAVYNALQQIPGAVNTGSGVFNLLLPLGQAFDIETSLSEHSSITPFDARSQGQFLTPVIPEPSTLTSLLIPAGLLAIRRRANA
jgi:hypothetical protein